MHRGGMGVYLFKNIPKKYLWLLPLWNKIDFSCQYFRHLQLSDDDHPCYYEILITILTFSLFTLELGHDEVWEVASSGFSDVNAAALRRTYYLTSESPLVILDYDNNIWMIIVVFLMDRGLFNLNLYCMLYLYFVLQKNQEKVTK